MMNKKEIKDLQKGLEKLLLKVGDNQVRQQKHLDKLKVTYKEAAGVASEVDFESEELLIKYLSKWGPASDFVAEESSYHLIKQGKTLANDSELIWFIDPLDGTNNYLSGLDYFSISLALYQKKGWKPLLGVVYRPTTGQVYFANEDGAFLKNLKTSSRKKNLSLLSNKRLKEVVLATGFILDSGHIRKKELDDFCQVTRSSRGVRRLGSAALDICLVADGRLGGFWERGLNPWDTAAASYICLQAGGRVTDYNGQRYNPFSETVMATSPKVYRDLKEILAP